jgi:hypothetical protein
LGVLVYRLGNMARVAIVLIIIIVRAT